MTPYDAIQEAKVHSRDGLAMLQAARSLSPDERKEMLTRALSLLRQAHDVASYAARLMTPNHAGRFEFSAVDAKAADDAGEWDITPERAEQTKTKSV